MSKKSNKQKLKEKKAEKIKKKKEIEAIIDENYNKCVKIIDDAYAKILGNLDEANNKLLNMSNVLTQEKQKLQIAIKQGRTEDIEEIIENGFEMTDEFISDFIRLTIPRKNNSIATPLAEAGNKACAFLDRLEMNLNLLNNKNATYITSAITNKLIAKSNEYSDLVCTDFYVNNPFITMFNEALDDYNQYVKSLDGLLDMEIEEVEVEEKIYKISSHSRLRCTHADMMNFAKAMGYEEVRQTNTTHRIWKHKETGLSLPIPAKGGKTIPQGTMSRILNQMHLKRQDLVEFLNS